MSSDVDRVVSASAHDAPDHRIVVHLGDVLERRGMTLTELSERIGVTLANLSILKTGKARAVRFTTLTAICEVLDTTPGELFGYLPPDESATPRP